jgi:PAS domain S-box-containing protein
MLHRTDEILQQQQQALLAIQQAMETAHHWSQIILGNISDGALITDHDGKIHEANATAAALLALPQDALRGRLLKDFMASQEHAILSQRLTTVKQSQDTHTWDCWLYSRQGPSCHVMLTVTALPSSDSQGGNVLWLLRDLDVRRQAKAELRRGYEFLEQRTRERTAELTAAYESIERRITALARGHDASQSQHLLATECA